MADPRFEAFIRTAKSSYSRSIAKQARDWTPEHREKMGQHDRAMRRDIFDEWARKALMEIVPAGTFNPEQYERAVNEIIDAGIEVIDAALHSPPGAWIATCAGCFQLFVMEVVAELSEGAAAKFELPAGWICPECDPRKSLEVLRA